MCMLYFYESFCHKVALASLLFPMTGGGFVSNPLFLDVVALLGLNLEAGLILMHFVCDNEILITIPI